jgi:hypothetical protein
VKGRLLLDLGVVGDLADNDRLGGRTVFVGATTNLEGGSGRAVDLPSFI